MKKPAEPATGNFWESPIEPVYHNIRKNLKGHPHAEFIEVYLGLGAIVIFLLIASLAPYIGEKLGLFSLRKEGQQSFASQEEADIKILTDSLLAEYANYQEASGDVPIPQEQPQIQPESPQPQATQSAQPEVTAPARPESPAPPQQDLTATQEAQVQGEKTKKDKKDKKEKKEDIEKRMVDISKQRKEKLLSVIEKRPDLILQYRISKDIRDKLPPSVRDNIEEEIDLTGSLEVLHEDDFENQKSREFYFLKLQNQRLSLHTADPFSPPLSGSKVRVTGVKLDDKIAFTTKKSLEVIEEAQPDSIGEQKTIVLLVLFQDIKDVFNLSEAAAKAKANDVVFNQVDSYYSETSYNKTWINGDIFGWYTLPINHTCDVYTVRREAITQSQSDVSVSDYDRLIIIAPFFAEGGQPTCGWSGQAELGGQTAWIATSAVSPKVIGHEFGHNLGVHHARFLSCGDFSFLTVGQRCNSLEYGDAFDIMGGNKGQFNAPHKDNMRWFDSTNIQTVSTSGDYLIEPIETKTAGLKALKIQRAQNDYLYVEYRQPIGSDSNLGTFGTWPSDVFDGALLHIAPSGNHYPGLIDATPPGGPLLLNFSGFFYEEQFIVTLKNGQTIIDPATATKLSVVSKTGNSLTLNVTLGKDDWIAPTVSLTAPQNGTSVFGSVNVTAQASDASGIEKVEFYYAPKVGAKLISTDNTAPYSAVWDTTGVPNGSYRLYAKAYDNSGTTFGASNNMAVSSFVTVGLDNTDTDTDTDNDGFTNYKEYFLGTDPNKACAVTSITNDEAVDSWPPDFDDNRVVNTFDILAFSPHMGATTGSQGFSPRFDLDANGVINAFDIQVLSPYMGRVCK